MDNNSYKNLHGAKGIESLESMVESLKSRDYICYAKKNYKVADPEYGNEQFSFQFLIEFYDREAWILHHTTSIRDRINTQQWHSSNIKRLNDKVKKAYVVVPNSMKVAERDIATRYDANIRARKIYSAIDGVIPLDKAYLEAEQKALSLMEKGQAQAKRGLNFEEQLAEVLNNIENFNKWKHDTPGSVGYMYTMFLQVVQKLGLIPENITDLSATTNVPKLPSGGLPKADILITVTHDNNDEESIGISCKRSDKEWVSVHEYSADTFARILNPTDQNLKSLLVDFQSAGGKNALGAEKSEALEIALGPYNERLSKWVIGGIYGDGEKGVHWADYIITVDEVSGNQTIYDIDEYIEICRNSEVQGHFGTLFRWTYPSKKKGQKIQLKGQVL